MIVTKAYLQSMGVPEAVAAQILADVARDTSEAQKAAQGAAVPGAQPAATKADPAAARPASPLTPLTPFPGQVSAPPAAAPNPAPPPVQPQNTAALKGREKPADGDAPAPADKDAGKKPDSADDVLKRLERLEKENADQKAQLAARDYDDAARAGIAAAKVHFTSKAAERDFFASVREQKFPLKDGHLEGLAAYIETRRQAEPDAFASDAPVPRFVSATPSGGPQAAQNSQTKNIINKILAEQYGVGIPKADSAAAGQKE